MGNYDELKLECKLKMINLKSISIYIIIFVMFVRCSSSAKLTKNEPSVKYKINEIKTENLEIKQKEVVDFVIEVYNEGQTPIQINGIRSNCGCLIPEWSNHKIQKNEKSVVILKYYSSSKGSKEGNVLNYKAWVAINGKEEEIEIRTKVFIE